MTDRSLAKLQKWMFATPVLVGMALSGCKHPPGAERARQCIEAHVIAKWTECKPAAAKCTAREVEVHSHDDGPTETVMRVSATIELSEDVGGPSDHPVHFTVTMTPTEDGEYKCADVTDDRAGSLTPLPQ